MRVVIDGRDLPGVQFVSDGRLLTNVHVGVQGRNEPEQLVRADAPNARWELDVNVVDDGDDFRGPAVHSKRGERRFLYLMILPVRRRRGGVPRLSCTALRPGGFDD